MHSFRFWALPLLCLASFTSFSTRAAVKFEEAYKNALEKNELIKMQESEVSIASERVWQGFGQVLPKLSLNGTYTRQDDINPVALKPDQYYARFTLTQPLFHGLSDIYACMALRAKERSEQSNFSQAKATLLYTTADAFFGLLTAQKDLEDLQVLSELTTKRVKEIQDRVKIGRSRKGDLLSAQAQAESLNAQVLTAEAKLVNAKQNFTFVTGLPLGTDLEEGVHTHDDAAIPLGKFTSAVEKSPSVTSKRENFFAAEETVAASRGQHLPSIDFQSNYYLYRTGTLQDAKWDLGVTVTIPLFMGGTTQSALNESIQNRKIKELELARSLKETHSSVEASYKNWTSLLSQHKAYEAAFKAADENYKQQTKDYKFGLVTNLDVLQAMDQLQQTKRSMSRTYYESKVAYYKLKSLVGDVQ